MKLRTPQTYELELDGEGPYRLSAKGEKCKFSKPASNKEHAKLYTVSADGKLIYVGVAFQRMSARLALGFRAKGERGYHGYKWKSLRHRLVLNVWTAHLDGKPSSFNDLQIVEAEVAFLCRQQSGQWPSHQHEIHFYPSNAQHRAAAARIYAQVIGGGS